MARRISQALVAAALMTAAGFSSTAASGTDQTSQDQTSPVIGPNNVIAGRTYADWSAAWWQWAVSIPTAHHPLYDTAGCGTGQTGQVFFLGGKFCSGADPKCDPTTAKRQCTVPKGKNLYFPIVNAFDADPNATDTINVFREATQDSIDHVTKLEADLDGRRINAFRVQSTVFSFIVLADNIFGIKAGTYDPAVDDGWYVMLQPLSPGSHLLHFTGTFSGGFSLNITYQLKVSP